MDDFVRQSILADAESLRERLSSWSPKYEEDVYRYAVVLDCINRLIRELRRMW